MPWQTVLCKGLSEALNLGQRALAAWVLQAHHLLVLGHLLAQRRARRPELCRFAEQSGLSFYAPWPRAFRQPAGLPRSARGKAAEELIELSTRI
jgi:hypothetical protein